MGNTFTQPLQTFGELDQYIKLLVRYNKGLITKEDGIKALKHIPKDKLIELQTLSQEFNSVFCGLILEITQKETKPGKEITFTNSELGLTLGVVRQTINNWILNYGLKSSGTDEKRIYKFEDVDKFLSENPKLKKYKLIWDRYKIKENI